MQANHFRRPVSVLVVVFTDAGEVLLLRRAKPFDFWQSITGSLHADESHAQAARRELLEETVSVPFPVLRSVPAPATSTSSVVLVSTTSGTWQ